MKKRYIARSLAALVLLAFILLPSMVYRHQNEQKNRYYTTAVEVNRFAIVTEKEDLAPLLKRFREAGVTHAVIREEAAGYPKAYLQAAKDADLMITLEPDLRNPSLHDLEELVETYQCRDIKLHENQWSPLKESAKKRALICRMIAEREMDLVLTETLEQLSNYHPEDFSEYLSAAEGRILRSCTNGGLTYSERRDYPFVYYHHFNAALDRNIRYLIAIPLEDPAFSAEENAQRVVESMELLGSRLEESGYHSAPAPALMEYQPQRRLPSAAAMAMAMLMVGVMAELILPFKMKWMEYGSLGGAAAVFLISLLLPEKILLLYPTVLGCIAPCFGVVVTYSYLKNYAKKHGFWKLLGFALLLSLGSIYLGGCCIAGMINGWDYWLNELSFHGVKATLIAPILFMLGWTVYEFRQYLKPKAWKGTLRTLWEKRRWYHGVILLAAVCLLGLYLIRSGNVTSISFLETRMRDGLTDLLLARPRTKEFLFGWPFFLLFLYELYRPRGNRLLSRLYGLVAAILFASGINTFCHVFTPIEAILLRGIYGMILGLIIGGAVLLIYHLLCKGLTKSE